MVRRKQVGNDQKSCYYKTFFIWTIGYDLKYEQIQFQNVCGYTIVNWLKTIRLECIFALNQKILFTYDTVEHQNCIVSSNLSKLNL